MNFIEGFFMGSLLSFILFSLLKEVKKEGAHSKRTSEVPEVKPLSVGGAYRSYEGELEVERKPLIIGEVYSMGKEHDPFQKTGKVRIVSIQKGTDGKNYVQYRFFDSGSFSTSREEKIFREIYPLHVK